MSMKAYGTLCMAAIVVMTVAGCQKESLGARREDATPSNVPPSLATAGVIPGINPAVIFGNVRNPYAGNAQAAATGRQLFVQYNCSGCHGGRAGGGMGPSLRDSVWAYGNSDVQLLSSITEGRPAGMPTWGSKLPRAQIWQLITYIRTLGTPAEPDPPPPEVEVPLQ